MAVLSAVRKTRKYTLPSIEGAELEVFESLLVKDGAALENIQDSGFSGSVRLLKAFIKSWNLTDESGVALEINEDNIGLIPLADVKGILEDLATAMDAKKNAPTS